MSGYRYFLRDVLVSSDSVEGGIYALGKAQMRSTPSLRSFPNAASETVARLVWLSMAFLVLQSLTVERSNFHAALLKAIDGEMSQRHISERKTVV